MRFPRTALVVAVLATVMLAMLATPGAARAGGWAAVTLDSLPREPRAGQPLSLGFMVLQHGKTPVNFTQPLLSGRNRDSGETLSIEARQDGEVGHYVVDVAFPSAGTWDWEIAPRPFEATKFEPLAVLPAATGAKGNVGAPASDAKSVASPIVSGVDRAALRWGAAVLLLAAGGIALLRRRPGAAFGRRPLPRSR